MKDTLKDILSLSPSLSYDINFRSVLERPQWRSNVLPETETQILLVMLLPRSAVLVPCSSCRKRMDSVA